MAKTNGRVRVCKHSTEQLLVWWDGGVMLQPSGEEGRHWQLGDHFEEQQAPQVGEEQEQCCGGSGGVGLEEHGGVVDGNGSAVLTQRLNKLMMLAPNSGPMCQSGLLMLLLVNFGL